jgi:hypothetical protein
VQSDTDTRAPTAVEDIIFSRIANYPTAIGTEHLHKALAYLPDEIVLILQEQPSLIAPAVTAFYERDPVQLKACQAMQQFPPTSSGRVASVQLTRVLYGQLLGQRFFPPKPFERSAWFKGVHQGTAQWKQRDLGMKIVSLERLLADGLPRRADLRIRDALSRYEVFHQCP